VLCSSCSAEHPRLDPPLRYRRLHAFTLSQAGMVKHWWRSTAPLAAHAPLMPWALRQRAGRDRHRLHQVQPRSLDCHHHYPIMIMGFLSVFRHYERPAGQLTLKASSPPGSGAIRSWSLSAGCTAAWSPRSPMQGHLTQCHCHHRGPGLHRDRPDAAAMAEWAPDVPLVILDSPYRSVMQPVLHYSDKMEKQRDGDYMTIILPEFVPAKWWQHSCTINRPAHQGRDPLPAGKCGDTAIPYHLDQ